MENSIIRAIKEVMLEKKLSQWDLANLTGINQSTVSQILAGKRGSAIKYFPIICSALDIKMSTLYQRVADLEKEKEKQNANSKVNFSGAFDLMAKIIKD